MTRLDSTARVLVTGGAGFIGSALCRMLIEEHDATVVNCDKLTYAANLESLASIAGSSRYTFERGDICDRTALDGLFARYRPTAVLHAAAETHVDRSIDDPDQFVRSNLIGTYQLLEATRHHLAGLDADARARFRFVHISTDEVYGSLGAEGQFYEHTPYDPSSPYSATKAGSDHLVRAWARTYCMPLIVSNCSNNYGPYQFPEKLIPLATINALCGLRIPVYGSGANVRDWLHVNDHARGLLTLLARGRPGESYNFGGESERTNLQVVEAVCDILDDTNPAERPRRELISFVEDRPAHDARYAMNTAKVRDELGWSPSRTFEEGLRDTVAWYVAHREWWKPIRERVYAGMRLGLAR